MSTPTTNRSDEFLPGSAFWIRDESTTVPQPPLHRHEYFQIHVSFAGRTQQALGAAMLPIGPGTVSFILPLRVHRIDHFAPAEFFLINYRLAFLRPEAAIDLVELEDVPVADMPELAPFLFQEHVDFVLAGSELEEARHLCARMQAEHSSPRFYSGEFIRADLLRLIGLVCRCHGDELQALAKRNLLQGSRRGALARVSRYLRDHLAEPVNLADAAAAAYLSPNYLAHLLKRETGRTFVETLTAHRIDLACRLLAGSRRPVNEIAARVGFEDEAYFSRRFRQLRGVSPSQYRKDREAATGTIG